MKNYYPDKPLHAYFNKIIEMGVIIATIKSLDYSLEVKRSAYVIIRNETGNGKSVVNGTNIAGVQSDSGKWDSKWDSKIVGTTIKRENRTGRERGFVVFDTLASGIEFLCNKILARGIYIGGTTHFVTHVEITNIEELAVAYNREWVHGASEYKPLSAEIAAFTSMYHQAEKLFV